MSKKDVKPSRPFAGFWRATIACSILASSIQSAQAAGNGHELRDLRGLKAGLSGRAGDFLSAADRNAKDVAGSLPIGRAVPLFEPGQINGQDRSALREAHIRNRLNGFNNDDARHRSMQVQDSGRMLRLSGGVEFDLTSAHRNIVLGRNLFADGQTLEISLAGETKVLQAGSQVSAAEYVAAKQVLSGEGQKISLDRFGRATGGQVDLDAITGEKDVLRASDLVVARNVTTYGDFGKRSDFRLLGDLTNYGSVHTTGSDLKGGAIRAEDIFNHAGATITSSVDLHLDASGKVVNEGAIESLGNLTISAGSGIRNERSISASGDVKLIAPNVSNYGRVDSLNGSIKLDGPADAFLNVDNRGGTLRALNGAIDVRSTAYSGAFDSSVYGGDLLSRELNLHSGRGLLSVNVNQLTGVIHETGTAAQVLAATDMLNIGEVCLNGDPTFYNTLGGINIAGNIDVQENLVFIAAGDITSADSVLIQARDNDEGFNITFIAGASFTAVGGADQPSVGPVGGAPPYSNSGAVTLNGKKSKTGGGIILGNNVTINTRSVGSGGDDRGGEVRMVAFGSKTGTNAGIINVSGATITTGGRNNGPNGEVELIAAAKGKSVDAISTGKIDATGSSLVESANIRLRTTTPVVDIKGEQVTYDATGTRTSAARIGPGSKLNKGANVVINDLTGTDLSAGRNIVIRSGGTVTVNGTLVAGDSCIIEGTQGINSPTGALITGASPTVSLIELTSNGNIGSSSNPIRVAAQNLDAFSNKSDVFVEVATGTGSTIEIGGSASGTFSFTASDRTIGSTIPVEADQVLITASAINLLDQLIGGESVSVNITGQLTNANFTGFSTPTVDLFGGAGVGSSIDPFILPQVKTASVASSGDVFVTSNLTKTVTFNNLQGDNVTLRAFGPVVVKNAEALDPVNNGTIDLQTSSGTLTIDGLVRAEASVLIQHTGLTKKSKIVFSPNSSVTTNVKTVGLGDITISVGPAGSPTGVPDNVQTSEVGGTVTFTGAGVKAKAPVNVLTAQGADISINNGFAQGNISFGGNVIITADPPVLGDPIVRTGRLRGSGNYRTGHTATVWRF